MRSSLALKSEKYPNCCNRSSENHARTLHPSRRSFLYTAAGGLLSAAAPSNYINTKSAFSLPLHVMMFFLSRVHNITLAAALWTSSLYRGHIGVQTPFIAHVPWHNLIDVAELDRNVTKRKRSQQNVAGRDAT